MFGWVESRTCLAGDSFKAVIVGLALAASLAGCGGGSTNAPPPQPTQTPTIQSFSPTSGTFGTSVSVTGTNLSGATSVSIGGVAATTFSVLSATNVSIT